MRTKVRTGSYCSTHSAYVQKNVQPRKKIFNPDDCVPGGYYDAGDYLKLNFPMANAMAFIAWSMATFKNGFETAGQTAYAKDALKWGADYLVAAHPAPVSIQAVDFFTQLLLVFIVRCLNES